MNTNKKKFSFSWVILYLFSVHFQGLAQVQTYNNGGNKQGRVNHFLRRGLFKQTLA